MSADAGVCVNLSSPGGLALARPPARLPGSEERRPGVASGGTPAPSLRPSRASSRARAPARPQAPRGPRHVTAPSQGGGGGSASFGGGGGGGGSGSGSGSSCAASVEREARGCGEKGAPDRNG
ncbi:hypothetical protein J1605_015395 [Eschrichtius robustus]|uniref:Uncharacterized protein n=1 Tax=Eschrichtius robustus TaxID=9764 RepID=A0AB34GCE4_ESCRO|nr:hypothetical protein J1605_015395 [Eschrichtius robustus]